MLGLHCVDVAGPQLVTSFSRGHGWQRLGAVALADAEPHTSSPARRSAQPSPSASATPAARLAEAETRMPSGADASYAKERMAAAVGTAKEGDEAAAS